jgi:hypothetical protein
MDLAWHGWHDVRGLLTRFTGSTLPRCGHSGHQSPAFPQKGSWVWPSTTTATSTCPEIVPNSPLYLVDRTPGSRPRSSIPAWTTIHSLEFTLLRAVEFTRARIE